MKQSSLKLILLLLIIINYSCTEVVKEEEAAFDLQLTEDEKQGARMSPEVLWKFKRMGSFALSPDGETVLYTSTEYDLPTESRQSNIYSIPVAGGEAVQLTFKGGGSPSWFPDGSKIAFTSKGKLWTMDPDGNGKKEVNNLDGFEIYSIAPGGDKIYYTKRVKLDKTPNEKHDMPNANMRIIDDLMFRHWNYWHDYSYSHIFIASFDGESVTNEKDIMEGQRFESPTAPYFDGGEISWSPDGKTIAYTLKKLTGKEDAISTNTDIFLYNIDDDSVTNLTEDNMGFDRYPVFSPDGSMLAWQSQEEDGYESDLERLFIYSFADKSKQWLSEGWDYNIGNITWSHNNNDIFFTGAYLGTVQIFNINLSSSEISQISSGNYNYGPIAINGNTILSGLQSMGMAKELATVDASSGEMIKISSLNNHIYDHIRMGKSEERYIKASDGEDLHMWIIYPPDFDPEKKYPAILYCKGGPQGSLSQSWSYRWNYQMMAANGYIIVAPTRRGTSGFGSEWREQISGDYGGKNMQDYLDAIDYMAKEPFIDENRLGSVGASYGGYSVFYLAGMHENRFKAFISHCGMFNIESWYGSTEELWFPDKDIGGPYWNKPEPVGYKYSPHLNVDKWNTPIMIITGEHDYRIPYTQSIEAFTAAQMNGVPSRLLFYHDETHFVISPHNAVIWQREFFAWLDKYLK